MPRFWTGVVAVVALSCLAPNARAAVVKRSWDAVPGAQSYEFEIYRGNQLKPEALVKQGHVSAPETEVNIGAGVYTFRVRALEASGRVGEWSPPARLNVDMGAASLKHPAEGETIELSENGSPVDFEWSALERADDYELQVVPERGAPLTRVVALNSASVAGLGPGRYRARVAARANGEVMNRGKAVNFAIKVVPLPGPELSEPLARQVLAAWEPAPVRWTAKIPGQRSELVLERGSDVVWHESLGTGSEAWLPALPSGRYRLTVKTYLKDTKLSSQSAIDLNLVDDPSGRRGEKLGLDLRLSTGSLFGSARNRNSSFAPGAESSADDFGFFTGDLRLRQRIADRWGLEAGAGTDYYQQRTEQSDRLRTHHDFYPRAFVGADFTGVALSPTWPLRFSLMGGGREYHAFLRTNGESGAASVALSPESFRVWSAKVSGELILGGWSRFYDVVTELTLEFPLLARGHLLGSGAVAHGPFVRTETQLRRKLGSELRVFLGLEGRYEHLSVRGDDGSSCEVNSSLIGTRLGLDWSF